MCGGEHATNSRDCTAKFAQTRSNNQQSGEKEEEKKKKQEEEEGRKRESPAPPPSRESTSDQPKQKKTWASIVQNGMRQVSGTASPPPPPKPSSPPTPNPVETELRNQIAALKAQIAVLTSKLESALAKPQPPQQEEAMESDTEPSLENKLEAMMRRVQESIPTIVSQQIAKAMTVRKYANTRRLQTPRAYRMRRVISEDEEEDHQEQFPSRITTISRYNMARQTKKSPITLTQWNSRGLKSRTKRADLRMHLSTYEHTPAVVAVQEPGGNVSLTNYKTFQLDP